VVGCGKGAVWSADFARGFLETFEGLWRGNFVDKMAIYRLLEKGKVLYKMHHTNVEEDSAVWLLVHNVVLEDLVV
jgi:hypothetical protein